MTDQRNKVYKRKTFPDEKLDKSREKRRRESSSAGPSNLNHITNSRPRRSNSDQDSSDSEGSNILENRASISMFRKIVEDSMNMHLKPLTDQLGEELKLFKKQNALLEKNLIKLDKLLPEVEDAMDSTKQPKKLFQLHVVDIKSFKKKYNLVLPATCEDELTTLEDVLESEEVMEDFMTGLRCIYTLLAPVSRNLSHILQELVTNELTILFTPLKKTAGKLLFAERRLYTHLHQFVSSVHIQNEMLLEEKDFKTALSSTWHYSKNWPTV